MREIRGFFDTSTMSGAREPRPQRDDPSTPPPRPVYETYAHTNADGSNRNDASAPSAGTAFVNAFSKKNAGRIEKSSPPKFRPRPRKRLRNGSVTTKSGCNKGWPCACGNQDSRIRAVINALYNARKFSVPLMTTNSCAEHHGRSTRSDGLKIERETTHDLV